MKTEKVSHFRDIANAVFTCKDFEEAKQLIKDLVNEVKIKPQDKQTIIRNVDTIETLPALQKYMANSMLKFEGMGTK